MPYHCHVLVSGLMEKVDGNVIVLSDQVTNMAGLHGKLLSYFI